jgi:FMN-dependent NADH-azoreductase
VPAAYFACSLTTLNLNQQFGFIGIYHIKQILIKNIDPEAENPNAQKIRENS